MCSIRGINNPFALDYFACSSLNSRLKRTLVAVWCGENHWRAKRWTFWLITRPAPNANFQIITVFSMAAVAAGYSVHYNQTNNENALLGYENERVERAKLQPSMVSYDMIFEQIDNSHVHVLLYGVKFNGEMDIVQFIFTRLCSLFFQ